MRDLIATADRASDFIRAGKIGKSSLWAPIPSELERLAKPNGAVKSYK